MIYEVRVEDYKCEVEVAEDVVRINDEPVVVDLSTIGETNQYSMILNGVSHRMRAVKSGRGSWDIRFNGRKFRVDVLDCLGRAILEMKRSEHQVQRPRSLSAPMPGVVVSVEVELGDLVEAGQGLVIVERPRNPASSASWSSAATTISVSSPLRRVRVALWSECR